MGRTNKISSLDELIDLNTENAQVAEVRRLTKKHCFEAVRTLVEVATGIRRDPLPNAEGFFEMQLDEDGQPVRERVLPGPRVAAAKAIIEHAEGRPTSQASHQSDGGSGGVTVLIQQFSSDGKVEMKDVTPVRGEIAGQAS